MFQVHLTDVNAILKDYGFRLHAERFAELQRYNYEKLDPASREVRLIIRADLENGNSVVIRFKMEDGVTLELLESQCRFAELLRANGIPSPEQYRWKNGFVKPYRINGYEVFVCIEEFVENQIQFVDETIAYKTGALLAKSHNIAEHFQAHVENAVLFDPFEENELFFANQFRELCQPLEGELGTLSRNILYRYEEHMEVLAPLQKEPKYAVQGDISDCNLYQTSDGSVGVFDFNRCGDNCLFCDAVMQGVFEARLMDYPEKYGNHQERPILHAFFKGYQTVRPFSDSQKNMLPYLYAIIISFWAMDIRWNENSLANALSRGDMQAVEKWLHVIWQRISQLPTIEALLGDDTEG